MEVSDLEDEVEGLQTRVSNVDSEVDSVNEYIENRKSAKKRSRSFN